MEILLVLSEFATAVAASVFVILYAVKNFGSK